MKKILAVLLALLAMFTFVACGSDTETEPDAGTESEVQTDVETDAETDETEPETDAVTEPVTPSPDSTFVDRDETVYVMGTNGNLNVRSAPSSEDAKNIVGTLKEGETAKRVGYNENWSKIEFNGQVCYASSKYLSTKAPVEFTDTTDTVYVKVENTVNLRVKPWAESDAVAILENGTALTRTGVAKDGDEFGTVWSRVEFVNKDGVIVTGYVNSKFLTSETPLTFTEVNETVVIVNCETLNLRAEASLSGNPLASLAKGTELQRVGVATTADVDGVIWSKIIYEGNVCYASSSYLELKAADSAPAEEA